MIDCLAASNPLEHVVDHVWKTVSIGGRGGTSSFTLTVMSNHVFMMLLAAGLLMLIVPRLARTAAQTGDEIEAMTPRGGRNVLETLCTFLREFVARPNMGKYTDQFIVYVWSVFFFILTINLLGLLPLEPLTKPIALKLGLEHGIYGTPTGNIYMTATLATCTFFMIVFNGLRLHGMAYVKHFFMGPFPINILIAFLEMVGLVAKMSALAIRLFANMMAGHILLAVLVGFIASAGAISMALGATVSVFVVLGSVAITMLELFVAFLQAFIFTFLSCVFIGQAVNIHHEEHEEHEGHQAHGEKVDPHGQHAAV